jgi:hypothetical protein
VKTRFQNVPCKCNLHRYTAGVALGRCVEFGVEQAKELEVYLANKPRVGLHQLNPVAP